MASRFKEWFHKSMNAVYIFTRTASALYVFSKYGAFLSRVSGASMYPTFLGENEVVVVDAVTPWLGKIEPGDVVICVRPFDPKEHIIKRVTAVEGQEVVLYPDKYSAEIRRLQVPKGHVWIQGDNLLHSLDSRVYGPVPLALVRGRVVCQIWPPFKVVTRSSAGFPDKS